MGRRVTSFNTDVCIYNQSVNNEYEARNLLDEIDRRINRIKQTIEACIFGGIEVLRDEDDEASKLCLYTQLFEEEYGIYREYEELVIARRILEAMIKKFEEDKDFKPDVDWGHYGDFNLFADINIF